MLVNILALGVPDGSSTLVYDTQDENSLTFEVCVCLGVVFGDTGESVGYAKSHPAIEIGVICMRISKNVFFNFQTFGSSFQIGS